MVLAVETAAHQVARGVEVEVAPVVIVVVVPAVIVGIVVVATDATMVVVMMAIAGVLVVGAAQMVAVAAHRVVMVVHQAARGGEVEVARVVIAVVTRAPVADMGAAANAAGIKTVVVPSLAPRPNVALLRFASAEGRALSGRPKMNAPRSSPANLTPGLMKAQCAMRRSLPLSEHQVGRHHHGVPVSWPLKWLSKSNKRLIPSGPSAWSNGSPPPLTLSIENGMSRLAEWRPPW